MVHPIYLTLAEAAEHLADKTGKRVTADWLLEHGSTGALQVYFMLRRPVMLEEANIEEAPTFYSTSDRLPLSDDWAKWMLGEAGEKPSIEMRLLPLANGQPRWALDCATGKRMPVEILKTDLYVRTADIDQFMTGAAPPSGTPKNKPETTEQESPEQYRARLLHRHNELKTSGENAPTKTLAEEENITDSRVRSLLREAKNNTAKKTKAGISLFGQLTAASNKTR